MASTGVNVLRWSALGLGLFYGVYHQAKISSKEKTDAINREYERKQKLIAQAKAEYTKRTSPPSLLQQSGVITDPEDPKFDLEAYLKMKAEEK